MTDLDDGLAMSRTAADGGASRAPDRSPLQVAWRFLARWPLGAVSGLVVAWIITLAIVGRWVAPYEPNHIMPLVRLKGPSPGFLLGTDQFGRDVLSQVIHGAKISIVVGFLATLLGSTVGAAAGLIGGYHGGWLDAVQLRVMDMLMVFPTLILAVGTVAVLGASVTNLIVAVALPIVPRVTRVVRSRVLSVCEMTFVEAARALGRQDLRILLRHLLPNCVSVFIVLTTSYLGRAIIVEASINFLGLGLPPDVPTWGNMLGEHAAKYFELAPWMAVWPGLAIGLTVLSFNLLGDTIRDILDPRLR
jgi:peptide/nickel transport system permease protein